MVDWKTLENLASVESMISLAKDGRTAGEIPAFFQKANVPMPTTASIEEITILTGRALSQAERIVKTIREEQESLLHGIFVPREEQLLVEWIKDGR